MASDLAVTIDKVIKQQSAVKQAAVAEQRTGWSSSSQAGSTTRAVDRQQTKSPIAAESDEDEDMTSSSFPSIATELDNEIAMVEVEPLSPFMRTIIAKGSEDSAVIMEVEAPNSSSQQQ